MFGIGDSEDGGVFVGFGKWVVIAFLYSWGSYPLEDTLSHLDCGLNFPNLTRAQGTHILDRILLLFLDLEVEEIWREWGDLEVFWLRGY